MKTLIFDTASPYLFVAIMDSGKTIFERVQLGNNNHSEKLLDVIQNGLDETKLEIKDFDQIIVGLGPGSYTGVRVSMVVAKMFAWSLNIPLYTISSLDIIASRYRNEGIYCVLMDAKRDFVYAMAYEVKNGIYRRLEEDTFVGKDEACRYIDANYPTCSLVYTPGFQFNGANIENFLNLVKVEDIHALVPNYLRKEI